MVVKNPTGDPQRGDPATEEGAQHLADGRRRQRQGLFTKAMVAGLLLIAVATLVNFLLLSWDQPTKESAEVVVASLLTSALLVVTVSIATAVVIRSMAEEDNRVGDHDTRIGRLEGKVKVLDGSLEKLNEGVEKAASLSDRDLPKKVENLEANMLGLPEKVEDIESRCRDLAESMQKAESSRGRQTAGD